MAHWPLNAHEPLPRPTVPLIERLAGDLEAAMPEAARPSGAAFSRPPCSATVSDAGTKRERARGIQVDEGESNMADESDMAEAAHIKIDAQAGRGSKVPEIVPAPAPATSVKAGPRSKRSGFGSRIIVISRVIVIAIAALLVGSWYWLYESQYEDADDAQIEGTVGAVSSTANSTTTDRGSVR
jgi:hypothetical protein